LDYRVERVDSNIPYIRVPRVVYSGRLHTTINQTRQ
jgi:hypothetical protein